MIRRIGQAGKEFFASSSSYQLINMLVAWLIIFLFAYFALYGTGNNDYPAGCAHIKFLGDECPTCGLSRSMSEMLRGNLSVAAEYNRNGPLIFGFFALQLLMRIIAGVIIFRFEGRSIINNHWHKGNTPAEVTDVKVPGRGGYRDRNGRIDLMARIDAALSVILFIACFRHLLVLW